MIKIDINLVFTIINLIVLYLFNEEVPFRPDHWCYGEEKSMMMSSLLQQRRQPLKQQLKGQYEDALKSAKEESFSIVEQAKDEAKSTGRQHREES